MVPFAVATATLAALLAFLVEPYVGKLLLPTYGGAAAVWTTALAFFQAALLAGYAIAHLATRRLGLRRAVAVEIVLVGAGLLALPVALPAAAAPPVGTEPAVWLLGILTVTVGAPFVALASTTPTLQRWLVAAGGPAVRAGAVRLFAASNAGSLVGLVAYPVLVEPNLDLADQARLWAAGYALFAGLVAVGGLRVLRRAVPDDPAAIGPSARPPLRTRLAWIGLAAIPAALVVGTTAQLTVDVAAVPLLWVVPLAVYLATFVLAFAGPRPIGLRVADVLLPPLALGVAIGLFSAASLPLWFPFSVDLGALACAGIVCHGRLSLARPIPERLTEYDLAIAAGGALGGLMAGIGAPLLLPVPIEGLVALAVALAARWGGGWPIEGQVEPVGPRRSPVKRLVAATGRAPFLLRYLAALVVLGIATLGFGSRADPGVVLAVAVLGLLLGLARWPVAFAGAFAAVIGLSLAVIPPTLESVRTFYGERRVVEDAAGRHALFAGSTVQGIQRYVPVELRSDPVGYYERAGPLGDVVTTVQARVAAARIEVIGLGVGALAAYGRPGDTLTFHEIDPAIVTIARDPRLFTYLADTPAQVDVVVGDGRLGIAAAPPSTDDLIVVDAFDSDAVPVHLLTREAVALYVDRLRPGGLVAFNVSNRFVALEPVLAAVARDLGLAGLARIDDPAPDRPDADPSHVVVLAREPADLASLAGRPGWRRLVEPHGRAWTDRFSDLFGALGTP
jgi:hypothetical protein